MTLCERRTHEPGHMTHLAPSPRLALGVEMQRHTWFRREPVPIERLRTDEIDHLGIAVASCRAERPAGNRTHVVFELADGASFDRPMPGVVHARRDLVHH